MLNHLSVHGGIWDQRNFDSVSNTLLTHHNIWVYVDAMNTANELALSRDTDRVPKAYIDCLDFIADVFKSSTWATAVAQNVKLLDAVAPSRYSAA